MKNSIKTISIVLTVGLISCSSNDRNLDKIAKSSVNGSSIYEETTVQLDDEILDNNVSQNKILLSESSSNNERQKESTSEKHQNSISSVAAKIVNDNKMRFIRKARLKYKTSNVRKTTYYLENSIVGLGGIVTNTNLYSDIESVKKIAINNDSSLKVTTYQMNNNMTIRIPNDQLDSLLKIISKSVSFLDERVITANEVSLVELKNNLERTRLANHQSRLNQLIKYKSGKLNKIVDAHEGLLLKKQLEDEALIRNLELDYEVEYSTVQLTMYQASSVDKELVKNEFNIKAYQPSFFKQVLDSLINGWNVLLLIIVQLANIWFVFILTIIGVILFKRKK